MTICKCRNCPKIYDSSKSRSEWRGYCSAKCLHEKAKALGYSAARQKKGGKSEYQILKTADCLGDIPTAVQKLTTLFNIVKLKEEPKSWYLRIGPQTLAAKEEEIKKIIDVQFEWYYKDGEGENAKWYPVQQRRDANAAVLRIRKPGS